MPKVLITNMSTDAGLTIIRSLAKTGWTVIGSDFRRLPLGITSRYTYGTYILTNSCQKAFETELIALIQNLRPDVFLPIGSIASMAAARHRKRLMELTALNAPDESAFFAAYNKATCILECMALGIPCPAILTRSEAAKKLETSEDACVVIKPDTDIGAATGICYARNVNELERQEKYCQERFGGVILQEYVPGGPEAMHTVLLLFSSDSRLLAAFTSRKFRQFPHRGGLTVCAESTDDQALVDQVLPFFTKWKWRGPAEVELKLDARDGQYKVIEINPRFPGYVRFPCHCGLELPKLAVQAAQHSDLSSIPFPSYRTQITYVNPGLLIRSFLWELRHTHLSIKPFLSLLRLLVAGMPYTLSMLADPLPAIARTLHEARKKN